MKNDQKEKKKLAQFSAQRPNPLFTDSNASTWAGLLTLPRRMIQPSGISEGSCYICSAAVKCGLVKCITLGALNASVMS